MKLLLHADVPRLGYFGDIVEVAEGYARNYLLPQRLAVTPTESNVKAIEQDRAHKAEERRLARSRLLKTAEKVAGAEVSISVLANEIGHLFGSVSQEDIAKALCEKGFEVQVKHVVMSEHIRMLGEYEVKLRFAEEVEAGVTVKVIRPEGETDESRPDQDTSDEQE